MDSIKKKFLEVLEQSHGIVVTACKSCGIERSTYYKWLKIDDDFKKLVDDIQDIAIDFVESKLMEKVSGVTVQTINQKGMPVIYDQPPSDTAIIFFLKTRGKKRGYIERMEVDNMNAMMLMTLDPLNASTPTDNSPAEDSQS